MQYIGTNGTVPTAISICQVKSFPVYTYMRVYMYVLNDT